LLLNRSAASSLFLLVLALAFIIPSTEGQGGAVRGQVFARDYLGDYVPAGFATIIARSEFFETTMKTNSAGYYFAYLPAGTYNMTAMLFTVTLDYFQSETAAIWDGSDTTINFYLQPITTYGFPTTQVSISIDGVPRQYTADLRVDDSSTRSILGGETVSIEVDLRVDHTFSVQSSIESSKGSRFYCQDNLWHLGKSTPSTREERVAHTFYYSTQYFLSVSAPAGDVAKNTGWYDRGSTILLTCPQMVQVTQGTRDVFDSWIVSASVSKESSVSVVLNSPVEAKAEYHREHYLQLLSAYGSPSGSGWYKEGSNTQIGTEKELPMPGLLGVLGGKRVFGGWSGGIISADNIAQIRMDSPKTITANWQEDYSTICFIIIALAIFIIIVTVATVYGRKTAS
jgi:hypothetical protein